MMFIKKTHTHKKTIMDAFQLGLKHMTGHLARCPEREVLFEDFEITHGHGDFKFTVYAPVTFGLFRDNLGIRSGDFQRSLCSQPLTERSDGQRDGGSLTYLSGDDRLMVSTLQPREAEVLQQMLPHLNQDRQSLLPRFLGLYCVQMGTKKVQLAVMSNPIPSSVHVHLKYDLKGSSNRTASAKERTKENPTYKELEFTKDLPGGLLLSKDNYKALCRSIWSDCLLLQGFGMMNYRLLVGILNLDSMSQEEGKTDFEAELMGGMPATNSKGESLLVFVGINDIFQPYTFAKKLEHYFKAVIYDANTVSVSQPIFYSKRFQRFMCSSVFKPVADTSPGDSVEPSSVEARLEVAVAPEVEVKAHRLLHVDAKCPSPASEHVQDNQEEEDEEGKTHQSAENEDLQSVALPIQGVPISATSGHDALQEEEPVDSARPERLKEAEECVPDVIEVQRPGPSGMEPVPEQKNSAGAESHDATLRSSNDHTGIDQAKEEEAKDQAKEEDSFKPSAEEAETPAASELKADTIPDLDGSTQDKFVQAFSEFREEDRSAGSSTTLVTQLSLSTAPAPTLSPPAVSPEGWMEVEAMVDTVTPSVLEEKNQEEENNDVDVRHQPSAKVKDLQSSGCGEHQKDDVQEDGVEEDGVEDGLHQEFKPRALRVEAEEKVESSAMMIEVNPPTITEEDDVHQRHGVEDGVHQEEAMALRVKAEESSAMIIEAAPPTTTDSPSPPPPSPFISPGGHVFPPELAGRFPTTRTMMLNWSHLHTVEDGCMWAPTTEPYHVTLDHDNLRQMFSFTAPGTNTRQMFSFTAPGTNTREIFSFPAPDTNTREMFRFTAPSRNTRQMFSFPALSADTTNKYNKMALRSKRDLSLCLLLIRFKFLKVDVIGGIQEVKLGVFDVDALKLLQKLLLEEHEVKVPGSSCEVDHVGDLHHALVCIPGCELRIECLLLCEEAKELQEMISTQAELVEKACRSLKESMYLPIFCRLVLDVGNVLNYGSLIGNAAGFRMSSLAKLADTKAYKSEITLLHYILREVEQQHGRGAVSLLNNELEFCVKAADVDLKHSQAELGILVQRLEDTGRAIASSGDRLSAMQCQNVIKERLQVCRDLEQRLSNIDRTRRDLALYLCEDADELSLQELFGTMKTFRRLFGKSLMDIRIWRDNCYVRAYPSGRGLPVQWVKA